MTNSNDFFERFGQRSEGITLPDIGFTERNVIALADHYDKITEPGEGFFFDFSATPGYEQPVIDYLTKGYGWTLERPDFIRKPEAG
jgi:hypothetical protein